ncbi:MAG: PadR family transcriptional regulator [Oligoflexia bacterium]|nr:PadR family transcriptional regulator [Oligoflexia bacterium]
MVFDITNWKTQIRKGYLELCLLSLIGSKERLYGFEILDLLKKYDLPVKEGTLYPILNRMTSEGLLSSIWETNNLSGHPRKFYSLTAKGKSTADDMQEEFFKLTEIFRGLNN